MSAGREFVRVAAKASDESTAITSKTNGAFP
jgi:hypothetical protein